MAGCGGQRGHVEQHQAVSSAGGHEDWGILARELRLSAHNPSLQLRYPADLVPLGTSLCLDLFCLHGEPCNLPLVMFFHVRAIA